MTPGGQAHPYLKTLALVLFAFAVAGIGAVAKLAVLLDGMFGGAD